MHNEASPQSNEVYRKLMAWLAGRGPVATNQILRIAVTAPIAPAPPSPINDLVLRPEFPMPPPTKELRFRRILGMGERCWAESMDNPSIRIEFDPNWEARERLDQLIAEVHGPASA